MKPRAPIKRNPLLTAPEHRMLEALAIEPDNECLDGQRTVWVGTQRFSKRSLHGLLRMCLVSQDTHLLGYYVLNAEGRKMLEDHTYIPSIVRLLRGAK